MKATLVADSSIILSWLFEDEKDAYAEMVLDSLRDGAALIPDLCWLETANALVLAQRRQRITTQELARLLDILLRLPLLTDEGRYRDRIARIATLSQKHRLTVYDATYLEAALRNRLPIATLDRALGEAAKAEGSAVLKRQS